MKDTPSIDLQATRVRNRALAIDALALLVQMDASSTMDGRTRYIIIFDHEEDAIAEV